jgi:hypothetical protein
MPQIFSRSADLWFRFVLVAMTVGAVGGVALAMAAPRSDYWTRVGLRAEQPVPFSHEHHVGGLGLDCRYCHGGVDTAADAGLPPTETCMTCHSQIWTDAAILAPVRESLARNRPIAWRRVARLPDYVYFRHDVHIASGVACESCHGRVDRMPLTVRAHAFEMQFCLECHRDPAPRLRPPEAVFAMGWTPPTDGESPAERLLREHHYDAARLTQCSTCHR